MTRHWLVLLGGLLVATCFVVDARGQNSSQPSSLLGLLGRSWSGGQQGDSEPAERRSSASTSTGASQRQTSPGGKTGGLLSRVDLDPLGLIPDRLLGQRTSQGSGTQPNHTASTQTRQATSASGPVSSPQSAPLRTATRPRAGSAMTSETFHDGFTLPGLSTPNVSSANSGANARWPEDLPSEYPVDTADRMSVSGIEGEPQRGEWPDPEDVIDFGSNPLRRELVGSYPVDGKPPVDNADITPIDAPMPEPADQPTAKPPAPTQAIDPITLPTSDEVVQPRVQRREPSARDRQPSDRAEQPTAATPPPAPRPAERPTVVAQPIVEGPAPDVLVSNQTPVIASDILGPRQILIGREAVYRVRLRNDGDVPADQLVASVRIPSWADVVDTSASRGMIQQSPDGRPSGSLEWQIQRLAAGATETLNLKLVPRASRPLELGVTWTCAPVGSRAVVEVQEPKLQMRVSGPDEVLFGKPQIYRLTLSNPGTGVAEHVTISLLPPGGGEDAVSSHTLGDLAPGASHSVDVELTAREAGQLQVKASATADGGLSSDAVKEIFCRKPALEVDWRGPENKYAGTPATFFFRVRNPGTASADDVSVVVSLPEGMKFTSASEGQSYDAEGRTVTWRVGSLGPGDDYYMELKGTVTAAGVNQLRVSAQTAAGDLSDSKLAETNVVALADLKLDVSDPSGPVAVGADAVYEVRIENRGASAAEDVKVLALFSEGIEPETAEGALYDVTDGRVTFRTIDKLLAGQQVVLRIRARGTEPGNHLFRAEVLCKDLDTRLAEEETTLFFADELVDGGDAELHSANASDGFNSAVR